MNPPNTYDCNKTTDCKGYEHEYGCPGALLWQPAAAATTPASAPNARSAAKSTDVPSSEDFGSPYFVPPPPPDIHAPVRKPPERVRHDAEVSVVANAIAYSIETWGSGDTTPMIDVSDEGVRMYRAAAEQAIRHLALFRDAQ